MSVRIGMDGKLYRNTGDYVTPVWAEMPNVKDVTLSLEKGEADVTTRGNAGWRAMIGTLKEGGLEFEMVWDTGDPGFAVIKEAYFNDTPLELAVMDGDIAASGSEGLRASFSVTSFTRNEPLEEAMTVSVSVKPTYSEHAPEWMVVP